MQTWKSEVWQEWNVVLIFPKIPTRMVNNNWREDCNNRIAPKSRQGASKRQRKQSEPCVMWRSKSEPRVSLHLAQVEMEGGGESVKFPAKQNLEIFLPLN